MRASMIRLVLGVSLLATALGCSKDEEEGGEEEGAAEGEEAAEEGGPTNWPTALAAGNKSTCALMHDETVRCWGSGPGLGREGAEPTHVPTEVTGLTGVEELVGGGHSYDGYCARTGEQWHCWGGGDMVPDGERRNVFTPTHQPALDGADIVEFGYYSGCAAWDDGKVGCWGRGGFGQLGNGTTDESRTLSEITVSGPVTMLAGGNAHFCAFRSPTEAQCWGRRSMGRFVSSGEDNISSPVDAVVEGLPGIQAYTAGDNFNIIIDENGKLGQWGLGSSRYAGYDFDVTKIQANGSHYAALTADGQLVTGGNNWNGQLGRGEMQQRLNDPAIAEAAGNNIVDFAAGYGHTCVLRDDHSVACFGMNDDAQLGVSVESTQEMDEEGNPATSRSVEPVLVEGLIDMPEEEEA